MKTIISILFVFCATCLLSAVEFNWKQLNELYKTGDYAKLESTAYAMKASAKNDAAKGKIVESIALSRNKLGKYANSDAVLTDIDAIAKEIGVASNTDSVQAVKMQLLYSRGDHERAIAISANWTGKTTSYRRGIALGAMKRYAEAATAFAAAGTGSGYVMAAKVAKNAKLPEKVYEYSYKALASDSIKKPEDAIELVNAVLDTDYTGTTITSAKIKEFLQMVNRKYSRKLVVNAPTKWDTLIQLVRQTLETY